MPRSWHKEKEQGNKAAGRKKRASVRIGLREGFVPIALSHIKVTDPKVGASVEIVSGRNAGLDDSLRADG
jgi:hypothetical protein